MIEDEAWRDRVRESDAVRHVSDGNRITYTPTFKRELEQRLRAGAPASLVFEEHGLPATLIGSKRIERVASHLRVKHGFAAQPTANRYTPEEREQMRRERERGDSYRTIAERHGCTPQYVGQLVRKTAKTDRPGSDPDGWTKFVQRGGRLECAECGCSLPVNVALTLDGCGLCADITECPYCHRKIMVIRITITPNGGGA